jgi:hypothetical protein
MFSLITNIYNMKTKGPTLMELFTAIRKLKQFFLTTRDVRCVQHREVTWQWRDLLVCPTINLADLKARIIVAVKNIDAPMLTRVWQELEYRIDVYHANRSAHIEHL